MAHHIMGPVIDLEPVMLKLVLYQVLLLEHQAGVTAMQISIV